MPITTARSRNYHRDTSCPGYSQGVNEARDKGRTIHPVIEVTVDEARLMGRKPCAKCM
ncbi:hypothetical protein [Rhodococcus opacus]|uniref:hypothetical protein n=1 Tax=Rhodococcus opacus TaxID=37919 RepID=UPI0022363359|nr:hypothetical protein [Rhodococcus opacus]UZG58019.1 hypothetical protein ONE62_12235 [Rhodococcus opacus]